MGPSALRRSVESAYPVARRPGLPSHVRWSWNGGRRIFLGDEARPGEVVVAGRGEVSHRTMTCAALLSGRRRSIARGWAKGGFYAVPPELADRFVARCPVCWSPSPRPTAAGPDRRKRHAGPGTVI